MNAGMRKNIPAATCFLSPRELEMAKFLFGEPEGLYAFGGYEDAERKMLIFCRTIWTKPVSTAKTAPACVCAPRSFRGTAPATGTFWGR